MVFGTTEPEETEESVVVLGFEIWSLLLTRHSFDSFVFCGRQKTSCIFLLVLFESYGHAIRNVGIERCPTHPY